MSVMTDRYVSSAVECEPGKYLFILLNCFFFEGVVHKWRHTQITLTLSCWFPKIGKIGLSKASGFVRSQISGDKESISPTFYMRLFRTKVLRKDFCAWSIGKLFLAQGNWRQCANKMLVKLTKGCKTYYTSEENDSWHREWW